MVGHLFKRPMQVMALHAGLLPVGWEPLLICSPASYSRHAIAGMWLTGDRVLGHTATLPQGVAAGRSTLCVAARKQAARQGDEGG